MKDFTKKTRDGYTVKRLYKLDDCTIGAVIECGIGNYIWTCPYSTAIGMWGHGHYGYATAERASEGLRKSYPDATPLNANSIYSVVKESNDVFGVFDSIAEARQFLYHIAKVRAPAPFFIVNAQDNNICGARFDNSRGYVIFSWLGAKTNNKLYRLLSTGQIRFIQWKE